MTSLARFRKKFNKDLIEQETPDENEPSVIIEVAADPVDTPEVVIDEAQDEISDEPLSIEKHLKNIDGMSKKELDEYALDYDIELDRRQTKPNMVNEFITKLKEKN